MTFELMEYNMLKQHFEDTVLIVKVKYSCKHVEQLPQPRKDQIRFLQYLIGEIDKALQKTQLTSERIKIDKTKTLAAAQDAKTILNGAMLLVRHFITDNLGFRQKSQFRDRLDDGMGIKEANKPSAAQERDCFRTLNIFLNKVIYLSKDPRKGINPENALKFISIETLTLLVKKSYECEEIFQKQAIEEASAEGSKLPSISKEKFSDDSVRLPGWEILNKSLRDVIITELGNKNVASIDALPKERAFQLNFLQKTANTLGSATSIAAPEKAAILAGAMHLIREQIGQEYKKTPLNLDEVNSVIHTQLSGVLFNGTTYSPADIEALVQKNLNFVMYLTTERDRFRGKNIFFNVSPENPNEVEDFRKLKNLLILSHELIKTYRTMSLDAALPNYSLHLGKELTVQKEGTEPTASRLNYFTSIFRQERKAQSAELEERDADQVLKETNNTASAAP